MNDENPYSSPAPLEEPNGASSYSPSTQVLLASFLGLQAGGMLGLCSGLLAPFRYLLGPVPFETVMLEDFSSKAHVQIIGESIFIAMSCLILGAIFGAILEVGERLGFRRTKADHWFLLSTFAVRRLSGKGLLFAIVTAAPPLIILTAAHGRNDGYLWLHGIWALAHLALSIYFGERFAEACHRAESNSTVSETNLTQ